MTKNETESGKQENPSQEEAGRRQPTSIAGDVVMRRLSVSVESAVDAVKSSEADLRGRRSQ